ncbi:complement factor H-like [Myxocyprinus asiaticus]|uniref:complement factor H-like n=1 Tax=Myxocyprinus asiaticus TaxID=70543 RepID=UPI002222BD78|nr:complement factor H-like [Myxocyprinus asiaticus]
MRVSVKILGFACLVFSFTYVQAQECLGKDIKYENIEQVEKDSYANNEMVKINCQPGFTGMYRLKCVNGNWEKNIARSCKKKKCGHPGDAPNGDFKLVDGTEFVFGATVEYTCKTGYEMASRITRRNCRSQGWDNAIPVCEVVKCGAIHTEGDVTASGNTEEGSYGDVIHFECVSPDKKLDGSRDIHCKENGAWSDSVPNCIEITCPAPKIPHGSISSPKEYQKEYKKDETLKYRCDRGYKSREGSPKCTKYGWSLNPECEEITCQIKASRYGIETIEPEGKTNFRVGEIVEITCSERHWFIGTKETTKSITCQDDGQWEYEPTCVDIKCEVPRDKHVARFYYYYSADLKLDAKITYACKHGFRNTGQVVTCTRDGWKPDTLCVEIMCEAPKIPNAEIVGDQKENYKVTSRIVYNCLPGFEPEKGVPITCNSQGQWTGIQHCTEKKGFCPTPSLENGFINRASPNEEEIFYSCSTGYKPFSGSWWESVTCNEGSWSVEPWCIREEECGAFPKVNNGKVKQTKNHDGEFAELECDPGFKSTNSPIKCVNGTWETPICEVDVRCDIPPKVENAVVISKPQEFYPEGSYVIYKCRNSYTMSGDRKVFCHNETWEKVPACEIFCSEPLQKVNNATLVDKNQGEKKYPHGDTVRYECVEGFESKEETTAKCDAQTWIYPECNKKSQCSKPTEYMEFVTLLNEKNVYNNLENVTYKCNHPYDEIPEGTWTCKNEKWHGTFVCTKITCQIKASRYGIETIEPEGKTNFRVGEIVEITCSERHWFIGTKETTKSITCQDDGQWDYEPTCVDIKCEVPRDKHVARFYNTFSADLKLDAKISYTCKHGFRKMGQVATCTRDGWKPDPLCAGKEECGAFPKVNNGKVKQIKNSDGEFAELECDPGFKSTNSPIKCVNGTWETPTCEVDVRCDVPPKVENAVVISKPQEFYPEGSYVIYKCRNSYTMSGDRNVFCHNETWEKVPACEIFCSEPLQKVNNATLVDKNQGEKKYPHGDTVRYECVEGFESKEETTAKCDAQTWIYPECNKKSQCSKPTEYMEFVTLLNEKNVYNNLENVTYKCNHPYDEIPEGTWTCKNEKWHGTFVCTRKTCPPPPPHLEHGDIKIYRNEDHCEITPDIIEKYNLQPLQEKVCVMHGYPYRLSCKSGWNTGDWGRHEYLDVSCSNGEIKSEKSCYEQN